MDFRYLLLYVMLASSGCVHTAIVQSWQPAQIDVAGIDRIAVLDFHGPQGSAVSAAMTSRLWENEFYTLVDRSEFQPVLQTGFSGHPASGLADTLTAAKAAGIDALLMGEVIAYECEDQTSTSTELNFGQEKSENVSLNESSQKQGTAFGLATNQVLTREGTVTIAFRLVDVETGAVRASRKVSHHFEGQRVNGQGSLPPQGEVLETLLDQCLEETLFMLAPHQVNCAMSLACGDFFSKGNRTLQSGNSLAKRGDWAKAEVKWTQVIEQNPENDAAHFNLALAAAHRQDYNMAESHAMQALRIRHKDCYAKGLEKIRSLRSSFHEAEEQREARIVPAMATAWK